MAKAEPRRRRENRRVLVKPSPKLGFRRFAGCSDVLRQELHFLRHATADDFVVSVESKCQRFPVEDLLPDLVVDKGIQFLSGGLPTPLRLEERDQAGKLIQREDDLPGRLLHLHCRRCWRRLAGDRAG